MNAHPDEGTLHRHVDADLTTLEGWEVETHLRHCAECAARVDAIRDLVGRVGALPTAIEPPFDLWPGIAKGISSPEPRVRPPAEVGGWRATRGRAFTFGLAAATAATLLLGLALGRQLSRQPRADIASTPSAVASAIDPSIELLAHYDQPAFEAAIADLQTILEQRRGELRPETVATLEENFAIIDGAIREAREALLADPANEHLHRHLAASMLTKLRFLRMAAGAVATGI